MRNGFAVFLIVHGLAHGVGFLTQTFLIGVEDRSTNPAFLLERLDRGHWFVRSLGVLWLALGVAFVAAGIGLLREADWTTPLLITTATVSTVLSVMWVREAPFGLVANVIVFVVVLSPPLYDRILEVGVAQPADLMRRLVGPR